jgi:hypothetical protein
MEEKCDKDKRRKGLSGERKHFLLIEKERR